MPLPWPKPSAVRVGPLLLALGVVPAGAQDGGAARSGPTLTPTLSVTQTLTDAYRGGGAGSRERSEGITTISPGLRLSSRSGRVQGAVDYSLNGVLYARDSKASNVQHRLSASGRAEVVPNHFDLNAAASISRQPTSAFGRQSVDGSLTDRNQRDVRTVSLQPVLRGVLGGVLAVQAAANASATDGGNEVGSRSTGGSVTLSPANTGTVVNWALTGSRQITDFDAGRETTTDRLTGTVFVRPNPEWLLSVRGGEERTDVASLEQRRYENWGGNLTWTPGPRTRVVVDGERRYFGNSHAVSLEHRMRRSVLRFSDSRSATEGSVNAGGGTVTAYDLFFQLFASQEPDPVLRDLLVRDFLTRNGVPFDTLLGGGFLTTAPSVQRRQELSLALNGQRSSVVVSAFQTRTERIDVVASSIDDLTDGPVTQRGLSVTLSHRLTPLSSLNATGTHQRSASDVGDRRNDLDSISVGWSTRLTPRSNLSLSLRHAVHDDATEPYTENALTAAFSTRF